jgi:hypothetical protein
MDKHIVKLFLIYQHDKFLDFDNYYTNNEQVLFLIHIPNLIRTKLEIFSSKTTIKSYLPVNG